MHKGISIILPTRHRINLLKKCVDSIWSTSSEENRPLLTILHDSPDDYSECEYTKTLLCSSVNRIIVPHKSSLSQLFNLGIIFSPTDWFFLTQDDVVFYNGWIEYLDERIKEGKFKQIHLLHYGGVCIHKSLILQIGWWDERIPGFGCEDNDWSLRMKESGLFYLIDRSKNFVFMKHFPPSGGRWKRGESHQFMEKKWKRSAQWEKPAFRMLPEIDWYPLYTQRYEDKYNMKSRIPYINSNYVDCGKEVYH